MRLASRPNGGQCAVLARPTTTPLLPMRGLIRMTPLDACSPAWSSRQYRRLSQACRWMPHQDGNRHRRRLLPPGRCCPVRESAEGAPQRWVTETPAHRRFQRDLLQTRPDDQNVDPHPCHSPWSRHAVDRWFLHLVAVATRGWRGAFSGLLRDPASDLAGRHVQRAAGRRAGAAKRQQPGRCDVSGQGLAARSVVEAERSTRAHSSSSAPSARRHRTPSQQGDSELCSVGR